MAIDLTKYLSLSWITESYLGNIITAILIFLVGIIIARIVNRIVYTFFKEFEISIIKIRGKELNIRLYFSVIIEIALYIITIIWGLQVLGITYTVLVVLVAIIMFVSVLAAVFGFRNFIINSYNGLLLFRENQFEEGDIIRVMNVEGRIISFNNMYTEIITKDNETLFIPNSSMLKNAIRLNKKE